ncbi:MAG TPA: SDR family NAD(P)-dependent oxidoreductase [Spirochaetia bacterium]|nr:SDR family NAD(P)-dependent oxidoreductase [Spirochaetia bacterium]
MKIKNYAGKLAFITGGSEGIGWALAAEFVRRGASVVVFSRSEAKLKDACKSLEPVKVAADQKIGYFPLDVSKEKDVAAVLKKAVDTYGVPDVFVNNAGRSLPQHFEKISSAQFDETMRINVYSIWYTLAFMLPLMKKKGGQVLNVSSMSGHMGVFGMSDYTASKFAIIGLSEAVRSEYLKYNITFSVLCPPDTDTPGFEEENKHKPEVTKAVLGNSKPLSAETVARVCLKGMRKGKFIIIPGAVAKLGYFVKRHWPWLLMSFFDSDVRKAEKKLGGKTVR